MTRIRINVIVPQHKFSDRAFVEAIKDKMRTKTIPDLKRIFGDTVEGWEHAPAFNSKQWDNSNEIGSSVFADGSNADIYALVSLGSPPHTITPKNGGFLRFQPGYRAATSPGSLRSTAPQRFGGFVRSKGVSHPGHEARNFPQSIKREYEREFAQDMQDAMGEGAKS